MRDGFNAMAERLAATLEQNRTLNEQIINLQEEERAELARDLHDEVAPFVFAVGADATMIKQYLAKDATAEIGPRADAISEAVRHMQRHLKGVLRRLAPGALLDLGLGGAIDDLIAFWATRRPKVGFSLAVSGEPLDPPLDAIAFRVVQESVSNAIRHGDPALIDILIDVDEEAATVVVEDDGRGLPADGRFGFGLAGMRDRVNSAGGTIAIRTAPPARACWSRLGSRSRRRAGWRNARRRWFEAAAGRRSHRGAGGRAAAALHLGRGHGRRGTTGREALSVFRAEKPEVVILDLNLPGSGGLDLLRRLLIEDPKVRVLIFSMHTTPLYVARALQAGAKGYISKGAGAEELVDAIKQVMAGGRYVERDLAADLAVNVLGSDESGKALSARELDIMRLLAKGKGLSDIADALGISYKTVANTCTAIKHKLAHQRPDPRRRGDARDLIVAHFEYR